MNGADGTNDFVEWYARVMEEYMRIQVSRGLFPRSPSPKEQLRSTFARLMAQPTEEEQNEKDAAIGFLVHDTFRGNR